MMKNRWGRIITITSVIGATGTAGGTRHVVEKFRQALRELLMEGRINGCNRAIAGGAPAGLVAPALSRDTRALRSTPAAQGEPEGFVL